MLGSLKLRIPVLVVGLAFASAVAVGAAGWKGANDGLAEAAADRLALAADARAELLGAKASAVATDLDHLAETALIGSSLPDLAANLDPKTADLPKTIAYFREGAPDARATKDGADSGTQYGFRHSKVHALIKAAQEKRGYADVLLLSPEGRVVYSVRKGDDFAGSVGEGALKGTGLEALYTAMKAGKGAVFQDFAAYPVAGAAPSAFLGRSIDRRSNAAMNAAQDVNRVGYVVLRMEPSLFTAVLAERDNLGATGETFAVGPDGVLRSDPPSGVARAGDALGATGLAAVPSVGPAGKVHFARDGADYLALSASVGLFGQTWTLVATQAADEAFAAVHRTTSTMLMTVLAVLCATLVIGVIAARAITNPLDRLTRALRGIAAGETEAEIAGMRRRDEIGEIARAVVQIREMTDGEAVARVAREEEQRRARDEDRRRMTERLARDFEERVGSVVGAVAVAADTLERSAEEMARLAVEANDRSAVVASASEQASGNVRSVAAATEQMFSSIRTVATMIGRSGEIATEADRHAAATNQIVTSLEETASRIGSVVDIIQSIAEQTNLLALNATIEAARAGEAGRGFAVVAGEVKSLAGQTARATEEIGAQIAAMRAATGTAVSAIGEIRQVVAEMGSAVGSVVTAVDEQSSATNEIARSAQGASDGTAAVSANIGDVRNAVARTDTAAAGVAEQARSLGKEAAELKQNLDRFVQQILAA